MTLRMFAFFVTLLFAISSCTENKSGALFKVDGEKYKFGEILEGRKVAFSFIYHNPGKEDLVIEDLFVSCFCVVIRSYDKVVKPGGKGMLYGVIETEGFQGEVSKSIRLKTNTSKEPVLTIDGKIIPRPK